MNVLSVVHGEDARTELFGPVAAAAGHRLDEWSFASGGELPHPLDAYGAVFVFGGAIHPDQDDQHAWMKDELDWLEGLIERGVPTLGICLGSQLLARAAGSWVGPLETPEIGWAEVELTDAGAADPVLSALPARFDALQWHHYHHGLPDGAVALARNNASLQGFRIGDACWGVQFHPEVTEPQLERWIDEDGGPFGPARLLEETRRQIGHWNELGRRLCRSFLVAAEQLAVRAA
ncbi:MAG TPA: type 1 glutamine amidotransferase [Gaiellaceae bacterium]|nr:type 1 glutamine amidotransferase [Gaiellaceae bacterium]